MQRHWTLVATGLIILLALGSGLALQRGQISTESHVSLLQSELGQRISGMGWQCYDQTQFHHQVHVRSDTKLVGQSTTVQQSSGSHDHWFFSVGGQVEESCLQLVDEFPGRQRWLVYYRWMADGLEQNIQQSDLNFQESIYRSLTEGVFVERTADSILSISQTHATHEVAYELWRMFLLSQILCHLPSKECQERWLGDHYLAEYEHLQTEQKWQKKAQLSRRYRHLNQVQSLTSVLQGQSYQGRPQDIMLLLHSGQQTSWAVSKDETKVEVHLQATNKLAAAEQQKLWELSRQAKLVLQDIDPGQQEQAELEKIYQQELVAVQEADLWSDYGADQNRTDRYLQIKAWVYLNRHQLDKVRTELLDRAADDPLLRLWIKALGQTGGEAGQQILLDTVLARSEERNLVKYTLAGLAFAEEPAEGLDQRLQSLIDDERIPLDLHSNVLLTLGTWAGRLSGERADLLSRFLLDRWSLVTAENEKMALVQAIGNSGYQEAKALLLKIIAEENSQRLIVEAVFALRFVEGAFDLLLNFLHRDPHKQGSIRALRFARLDQAQMQLTLNLTKTLPAESDRYQIVSSLLQNPGHQQMSPALWDAYLDWEQADKISEIIQNQLESRRLSGS